MQEKLRRFMIGRYGMDELGKVLSWTAIFLLFITLFFRNRIIELIPFFILIICYFRMFSRNINKRYNENQKYLSYKNGFTGYFKNIRSHSMQNKNYHIYACPTCKQKIRVPKGKGKICITCPKCKAEFVRKS